MKTRTLTIITFAFFAACTNARDTNNAPRVSPTNNDNKPMAWSGTSGGHNTGAMNADSDAKTNSDTDAGLNSGAYYGDNTGAASNNVGMNSGSAPTPASNGVTITAPGSNNGVTITAPNDQSSYTPEAPATYGDFKITRVYHDSMLIDAGGKIIYVNPRFKADAKSQAKADLILFTQMPEETVTDTWLGEIKTQAAVIYAPQAVSDKYPGSKMKVISTGKKDTWKSGGTIGDLTIEAPSGEGYVISTPNQQRVYVSGDKECFAKVTTVKNMGTEVLSVGKTTVSVPGKQEEVVTCLKASK